MELSQTLREQSGLNWVLDKLSPMSPFGRNLARNLPWYGVGQEEELDGELSNVAAAIPLWAENTPTFRSLTRCLPLFHDIRNSFDRNEGAAFDLVELFEVKHFLLTLAQVEQAYSQLPPFHGIQFQSMDLMLELLDPSGRRLSTFAIEECYHPDLPALRQEKKALEQSIRTSTGDEKVRLLEERRKLTLGEDALELKVRQSLTYKLMAQKSAFLHNMDMVARLDLTLSKGLLARRFHCTRPTLTKERLTLRGVTHPQVAHEVVGRGGTFTPVDVDLTQGCAVITGANMGGKTVAIRAIALNILLCQCGFFLFADAGTLPLFHHVALILADNGVGSGGLSSFGTEVALLDNLLKNDSDKFFFVALDEFARGTNPQEGATLAKSLVKYLGTLPCVAVMTTHYDGIAQFATAHYQVAGLTQNIVGDEGDDPKSRIARRMDYALRPARPDTPCPRDALEVCRLLNLDQKLLNIFSESS